jgi:CDP-glycerol glycerophosphotransferase (TagB/SpsB family)
MTWFRDLLFLSDVVINTASTTTIDAAALDRPVINIAFDGTDDPDPLTSVSNFYSFHHYRRIVESGGAPVVRTPEDCAREVARYLADPDRDAEGRRRIVTENCYRVDGNAARRVADALAGWLDAECRSR